MGFLYGVRQQLGDFIKSPESFLVTMRRRCPAGLLDLRGDRDVEWSWVAAKMPHGPGEALDFGTGGSPLGLMAAQKGFNVTAVDLSDVRWPYHHERLRFRRADILDVAWNDETFDLVINCSTVEHVGLVGRYGVAKARSDGDLEAMIRLRAMMKIGGTMLLTVPVGRDTVVSPLNRVYGATRLPELISGYEVLEECYWRKNEGNQWVPTGRAEALEFAVLSGSSVVGPCVYALGCFVLRAPLAADHDNRQRKGSPSATRI